MTVDGCIVNIINVVCTVNIRGQEANFYEAEARCQFYLVHFVAVVRLGNTLLKDEKSA